MAAVSRCQRCGEYYNPEWKSGCAAGMCDGRPKGLVTARLDVGEEVLKIVEAKIAAAQGELDALKAEKERLRQALRDVCSPMQMFLRGIPAEQRRHVDSGTMVRLCESVSFIQEIARKALENDENFPPVR